MDRNGRFVAVVGVAALLAVASSCACDGAVGDGATRPPQSVARVTKPVTTAVKGVGEDCRVEGPTVCLEAPVCLHYKLNPQDGFVCSRPCPRGSIDCPAENWSCQSIYPGVGNEYCVPPATWAPHPASNRMQMAVNYYGRDPDGGIPSPVFFQADGGAAAPSYDGGS
jgi:hypothetical protein